MPNAEFLKQAKKGKNDEFYTQYEDIQKEMNAYLEYKKVYKRIFIRKKGVTNG